MGKYDHLSEKEKEMLWRMARAQGPGGDASWVPASDKDGSQLLAIEGDSIDAVPRSEPFYSGLADKGFLTLGRTGQGSLRVQLQQPAIEYADYASKPSTLRWVEDLTHDLAEERTVWAKLFWVVLGYALGLLSGILLGR